MFKHEKMLFHPVEVERPNPQYAVMLQEQLGGGNGELKAAMQYMSQSFRIKDPEIKDLFLDIAAEELGHMEMVAQTINLLNGHDVDATKVQAGEIQSHVLLGLNPGLINASGYSWTGDYVTVTGDLCADLLSNIASEQRAKVVYEYLYRQIDDKKVRETIDKIKPGLPVFHNCGHIRHGRRDLANMNTHLELESLPTGGWGYDHFPQSAKYAESIGMEYLGMTGKFHGTWGEFGGIKHSNALIYETSLSVSNGAKISVGDQLHPS